MGWKIYNASLGRPQDEQLYNGVCLALNEASQQKVQQEKARLKGSRWGSSGRAEEEKSQG